MNKPETRISTWTSNKSTHLVYPQCRCPRCTVERNLAYDVFNVTTRSGPPWLRYSVAEVEDIPALRPEDV